MAGEVTVLLGRIKSGDKSAANELAPLVLGELRNLAHAYLRGERPGHTLQPTALVNEAYLRLEACDLDWQNRAHFIGVTASLMRKVLVDYSRKAKAAKRGGGKALAPESIELANLGGSPQPLPLEDIIALDTALDSLEKVSPRQREIVELRYFGGLDLEETAQVLGLSSMTVKRDWAATRAWLRVRLKSLNDSSLDRRINEEAT